MFDIVTMTAEHRESVLSMMRVFYSSPALLTDGSEEIYMRDVEACLGGDPCVEGYVFVDDGAPVGYAMTAQSFSTEYGRRCVWIEDIYLMPEYRGRGLAAKFFSLLEEKQRGAIFRLEVQKDNAPAISAYRKNGFDEMTYMEMKKIVK